MHALYKHVCTHLHTLKMLRMRLVVVCWQCCTPSTTYSDLIFMVLRYTNEHILFVECLQQTLRLIGLEWLS